MIVTSVRVGRHVYDLRERTHMTDKISQDAMLKSIEAITNRVGLLANNDGSFTKDASPTETIESINSRLDLLLSKTDGVTLYDVADALLDIAATCSKGIASMVAGAPVEASDGEVKLVQKSLQEVEAVSTGDVVSASTRVDEIMKNLRSAH